MEAVKAFNAELSSIYEVKPPISKAKMTAITRGAIKAIKFYKHVVQSVEKFILKCKPEYKVPGLYVIDSIVRQSRHQFGADKDVFAPRFAKNMHQTFINLFKCPAEDKSKIIRVLNLWQKNQVFAPDVIQPLFDLADPNNPIHKELGTPLQANGMNNTNIMIKGSPALQKTPTKGSQQVIDGVHLGGNNLNLSDPNVLVQFQQLQRLLTKSGDTTTKSGEGVVHFDRKLLDFDYGDDDDDATSPKTLTQPPLPPPNESVANLLTNPEVLRQLHTLQQTMNTAQTEMDMDKLRKLQEMKQQEEEFDKHLAQTVPNLPFASECEFKPSNSGYFLPSADLSQPPPGYKPQQPYEIVSQQSIDNDIHFVGSNDNIGSVEVITLDQGDSHSPSPQDDRYRRRRSRSRERSRDRRDRDRRSRRSRSRSRSRSRRHRSRSRDRNKNKEKESEKDRERKKRGLPTIKKDNLSVCSTTLWVGHLSKLVHQEDLSNTFGEFGDIVSIDLIPPRGCAFIVMHRRQDAARCLTKLKNHILHGKAITLAWAPGKGVKGKDLKDYWEGDLGVSYIPWNKIKPDIDLEMLEDGGMIDEDTMPPWMKAKVANINNQNNLNDTPDISQPPPVSSLLQPPPMTLPMVSPFQFNNRLLGAVGMNVPGMLSNIPLGVPPPTMPGPPLMQNQIVGLNSPFQGPSALMQQLQLQQEKHQSTPEINIATDNLLTMSQAFNMIPQPPLGIPSQSDDNMDIEMEDEKPERPPLLSEQLEASLGYSRHNDSNNSSSTNRNDINDRDDRRINSLSHERDRNRGFNRDDDFRDDRSRNRRKDDRRDRPNRWSDRENSLERREREKNLNDRLQQMANESIYSNHDRSSRDRIEPPSLLDRRIFPPMQGPPIDTDLDELYNNNLGGGTGTGGTGSGIGIGLPNDDYDNIQSQMIMDQINMIDMSTMHQRMHRDDFEPPERFMRGGGRRDFREPRRDFYGPRDNFGPRPLLRSNDYPRGHMMRPLGIHKFHPRGPPLRGLRPNTPWKDRSNFGGPRFDHPSDYYRGPPGPPGLFDESSHNMRYNRSGGRYDDRRRQRQDFQDNIETDRFSEKRANSRWSDVQQNNDNIDVSPIIKTEQQGNDDINHQDYEENPSESGGNNTPLHDEPLNRDESSIKEEPIEEKISTKTENIDVPLLDENDQKEVE